MIRNVLLTGLMLFAGASFADNTTDLLKKVTEAPGASGFERPVRDIILPSWQKHLKDVSVDGIGNVTGILPGKENSPVILFMAHMDEVGFMVTGITDDGFIEVQPIGGWRNQVLMAQRWLIKTTTGDIYGYSGSESGHLIPADMKSSDNKNTEAEKILIDVGANSKQQAMNEFKIRPGLPITPVSQFMILNNPSRYLGKGFDDRASIALLTQFIESSDNEHPNRIAIAATVQEELGLRGASVIYEETKPDIVFNIEACVAGDHPLYAAPQRHDYPALGKGPCIYIYERSMLPNNELVEWITKIARENDIPVQYAYAPSYGQDGSVLQEKGHGLPVVNIGLPVRYAHQQAGVIDRHDYDATLKLIKLIAKKMNVSALNQIKPA